MTDLAPVIFDAPLVNPSPGGLWAATIWSESGDADPARWLPSGVEVRPHNYGDEDSFGVWTPDWCAQTEDLGDGDVKDPADRPDWLDSFEALTFWAADECDLTAPSRVEVRTRAAQTLRLHEQIELERHFAARMLDDAPTPAAVSDIVAAVGALESAFTVTNTVGFIHASSQWAAYAAQAQLLVRSGAVLKTPLGNTWVFGGGYVDGLADVIVATSQPFGWRNQVSVREAMKLEHNRFRAIAERSMLVGYEALIAAAAIN